MWMLRIVILSPLLGQCPYLMKVVEPMGVQHIFPVKPVQAFHISILHGLSRLYEPKFDSFSFAPLGQGLRDELWAVVAPYGLWLNYLFFQMAQGLHYLIGMLVQAYVHGQCLAVAIVHHVEHPYLSSIGQYVGHEVHAPYVVERRWCFQRALYPGWQSLFVLSSKL